MQKWWKVFSIIVLVIICMTKSGFTFDAPDVLSVKVKQAPIVDGQLNDDCWKSATHLSGFYRIDSPEKSDSFKTDVYICYDEQNIYIAFGCQDSNPPKIQAFETKRGGSFSKDDHVTALIAPNYQQSAYKFQVNALGTQSEEIPGGSAIKTEWRGDWEAQAKINEQGWTAELKILFSILRHSHEQTVFGLALSRYVARLKETSAWPVGNLDPQMQAKWTNLSLSSSKGDLKIMPYLLAEVRRESTQSINWYNDIRSESSMFASELSATSRTPRKRPWIHFWRVIGLLVPLKDGLALRPGSIASPRAPLTNGEGAVLQKVFPLMSWKFLKIV